MRRATLIALAILLVPGTAVAGAAVVSVATGLLASTTKTLTRATCTLQPAAVDTTVNEGNKTINNGAVPALTVAPGTNARQRALIRFTIPGGCAATINNAEVDSATLTLNETLGTVGRPYKVYKITSTWTGATNWNTQPGYAAAAFTTFAGASGAVAIDVTQDVNDIVQSAPTVLPPYTSATSTFGWMIADEGTGTSPATFTSSDATGAANLPKRPLLVINYAY
jgi:hypothetical protein